MPKSRVVVLLAMLGMLSAPLWAQQQRDFASMSLEDLMKVPIEVATGIAKPISEAPAVVSVITADEIEMMGAIRLSEILETVPGFHMPTGYAFGQSSNYVVRGIRSDYSAQVLLMLNGVPVVNIYNGGNHPMFHFPVSAIDRVEVIRGPGSAVYGADAFAGLINIITKDAKDFTGTQIGVRGGSFGFQNAWLQYGGDVGGWELSLNLEQQQADGDDGRLIGGDAQSFFDFLLGTNASLAPGPIDTRFDVTNVHLGLQRNNWNIRLWGNKRDDMGMLTGIASALDHNGEAYGEIYQGDITYEKSDLGDWNLTTRLSHLYFDGGADFAIFPAGAVLPIGPEGGIDFSVLFPPLQYPPTYFSDGYLGRPETTMKTTTFDAFGLYTGLEQHRFRIGVGYSTQDLTIRELKNWGPGVLDADTVGSPAPTFVDGTMTDVSGTPFSYCPDLDRSLYYLSLQDEWAFATDWEATLGIRYDHYSDFGGTVNPRLALVWSGAENLIAKLLFATAYRAPAFAEQGNRNNPTSLGNPDLDPEEIQTTELVLDYQPSSKFRAVLNLFYSDIEGTIRIVADAPPSTLARWQNATDQESHGVELELFWNVSDKFHLRGFYALQNSEFKGGGGDVPWVPEDQWFLSANWRPFGSWYVNTQLKWIGEIRRPVPDPRPPVDSYYRLDLTLGTRQIADHWDFAVSARNLLDDEDARDAAFSELIASDLPIEGRRIIAELRFNF